MFVLGFKNHKNTFDIKKKKKEEFTYDNLPFCKVYLPDPD